MLAAEVRRDRVHARDWAGDCCAFPYVGLFPVATMLEKLELQKPVEQMLTVTRIPRLDAALKRVFA